MSSNQMEFRKHDEFGLIQINYNRITCQIVPLLRKTYNDPLESNVPDNASVSLISTSGRMISCLYAVVISIDVMISHKFIDSPVLDI